MKLLKNIWKALKETYYYLSRTSPDQTKWWKPYIGEQGKRYWELVDKPTKPQEDTTMCAGRDYC